MSGLRAGFVSLCLVAPLAAQPAATSPAPAPATQPGKVVQFQPHIRIDYPNRCVEVDGQVILRQGLLELFACSPNTREHESIVRLNTRPLFIMQALGLLGLEPGRPLRMDPDTGEIIPASGDPVEIEVRYEADGVSKRVPIETWMRHSQSKGRLERQPWVFAGSFPVDNGAIAADEEGTIIAVVDFESAIIALPRHHTAANAELWLEPNTPAIPDVGTPCTVIFRPGPLTVRLDAGGRLYLGHKPTTFTETARKLRAFARENPKLPVVVEIDPQCPATERDQLLAILQEMRIDAGRQPATQPSGNPATAPDAEGESSTGHPHAIPRWLLGQILDRPATSDPTPTDHPASMPAPSSR